MNVFDLFESLSLNRQRINFRPTYCYEICS